MIVKRLIHFYGKTMLDRGYLAKVTNRSTRGPCRWCFGGKFMELMKKACQRQDLKFAGDFNHRKVWLVAKRNPRRTGRTF